MNGLAVFIAEKIVNNEYETRKDTESGVEYTFANGVVLWYARARPAYGIDDKVVLKSKAVGRLQFSSFETAFLVDKIKTHEYTKKTAEDRELREKFMGLFEE